MENITCKKWQRSENWLEEDKHLLMDLVRERVSVIENKNTDTNTNSKKASNMGRFIMQYTKSTVKDVTVEILEEIQTTQEVVSIGSAPKPLYTPSKKPERKNKTEKKTLDHAEPVYPILKSIAGKGPSSPNDK
ncbi:unnamed protein product [Parnassius apollo]|uniref:Regulatory protein zeste n=1 Tax=Parnassius apollo TaxID=110799 RepID=A0A8S3W701_PARAO|nr:unnamed protein product [Parnassius apollo]